MDWSLQTWTVSSVLSLPIDIKTTQQTHFFKPCSAVRDFATLHNNRKIGCVVARLQVAACGERKVCQVQIQVHDRTEACILLWNANQFVPSAGSDFVGKVYRRMIWTCMRLCKRRRYRTEREREREGTRERGNVGASAFLKPCPLPLSLVRCGKVDESGPWRPLILAFVC